MRPNSCRLLAINGSLRVESYNKRLLTQAVETARSLGATVDEVHFGQTTLPFFNADLESERGFPQAVEDFRNRIFKADGLIIASPEYNGSLTAVLKNAIDWASRRRPGQPFDAKPIAIMGASPGRSGTRNSLAHLRFVLTRLKARVLEPELQIAHAGEMFTPEGILRDDAQSRTLKELVGLLIGEAQAPAGESSGAPG